MKLRFQADNDLDQRIVVATRRLDPSIDFLARTFGSERAAAACLVEREQTIRAALGLSRPGHEAAERSREQGHGDPAGREWQSYGFDR